MGQLGQPPGGGGGGGGGRDWWNQTPSGQSRAAQQQIAELLRQYPGAQQISDFEWVTPEGRVLTLRRDEAGNAIFQEGGADESARRLKALGAATGGGGDSISRMAGDDPRYWALEYAKLDADERLTLKKIEADLINAGLDANAARQQALAGLIANKNTQAVGLAGESINAAKIAADYAANPRDAVAELHFRNAVGGPAPFSAMSAHPTESAQYQTALDQKFQSIFGGVGADLQRARGLIDAPLPAEYLAPGAAPGAPQPGLQAPPAQSEFGGALEFLAAMRDNPQKAQDFRKWVTAANGGVPPPEAEDGINMNIHEPAMVIGSQSGRIYATLSEKDPEQLIVKPLPSVVERKKQEKESGKQFMKATQGAARMQTGGTITGIPQPSDFIAELRKALSALGGPGGGVGGFQSALPDTRLLAGAPANALEADPVLMDYALAGYGTPQGGAIDPRTVLADIQRFTPRSAQRAAQTGVRVSF